MKAETDPLKSQNHLTLVQNGRLRLPEQTSTNLECGYAEDVYCSPFTTIFFKFFPLEILTKRADDQE